MTIRILGIMMIRRFCVGEYANYEYLFAIHFTVDMCTRGSLLSPWTGCNRVDCRSAESECRGSLLAPLDSFRWVDGTPSVSYSPHSSQS
jgi:hypothetical protein